VNNNNVRQEQVATTQGRSKQQQCKVGANNAKQQQQHKARMNNTK